MSHCYSRSVRPDEVVRMEDLLPEGHGGARTRVFCPVRYRLSFALMGFIDGLTEQRGKVFPSHHHNFFSVEHADLAPAPAPPVRCFVFLALKKKREPNVQTRIEVTVETAYPALAAVPPPKAKGGAANFAALLGRVWSGAA